ncbi:MAG: tetratricopeptide repeat protein, partial [Pirellulales bacterium]
MRLVYLRLTLALFLSVLGGSRSALADGAGDRFAAAADHYRLKRWQQACDEFAGLLAADPAGPRATEARFFYGESLVQLGRWNDARSQFAAVLKADAAGPHFRQALFRSAEAAYMIGDDRAALGDLKAFWQRYPDDPLNAYVLPYLGSLELQLGHVNEAQKLFAQALDRFKDGPLAAESRFGLAQTLERSDKLEPALEQYRAVIEAGGSLAEQALLQLATAENGLGHYQAALAALDQFSARFPDSSLADRGRLGRGYSLHKLERHREAQDVLQPIAGKPDVGDEASYWLALVQKAQNNYPAASEILRGIRVDGKHPLAAAIVFHLADAELHAGQLASAQEAFDRVLTDFADSPWADDAQFGKLHVALERKEHAESIRLADALTARFPSSPLVLQAALAKGQSLAALDKPADAVAALEPLLKSIQATPADTDAEIRSRAQAMLAVAQAKLGHWKESQQWLAALRDAKTAGGLATETTYQVAELALAAGDAALAQQLFKTVASGDGAAEVASRARSGLAWSHFNAGRYSEAAEAFDKLLAADPQGPLAAEAALLKGRALEHLEQFEPALAMYQQVGEQYPKSPRVPEALFASARLYEQLHRTAEAR